MRLNSSISCEEIESRDFPSPCPGDQPFTVFWERVIDANVRICVPGNYTGFPWSLSRSRQDLAEEIYIDLKDTDVGDLTWNSEHPQFNTSYSIRCTATTTRGFFEIGSNWNNNTYGPLLEQWPAQIQIEEDFNDRGRDWGRSYIPSEAYVSPKVL